MDFRVIRGRRGIKVSVASKEIKETKGIEGIMVMLGRRVTKGKLVTLESRANEGQKVTRGRKEIMVIRAIRGIQGRRGKQVLIAPCEVHRA